MYPTLEKAEGSLPEELEAVRTGRGEEGFAQPLKVDADEDRVPRSMEEMEKEAIWLAGFFSKQTSSES